jgi:hypothetical protein
MTRTQIVEIKPTDVLTIIFNLGTVFNKNNKQEPYTLENAKWYKLTHDKLVVQFRNTHITKDGNFVTHRGYFYLRDIEDIYLDSIKRGVYGV